jgi:hypothetical protein
LSQTGEESVPRGVWVSAGFFALAGVLQIVLGLREIPRPVTFWPVWETLGRSLLYGIVAAGLWRRIALCRSIAMVYCLAALATHAFVLILAFTNAPVQFPTSVFVHSLYEVPSCALLFPYLRSPRAAVLFPRPLFGR